MSRRERPLGTTDRKLMRRMPMTILFHKMPDQPRRLFDDQPQLHRLVRAGFVSAGHDASANAVTLDLTPKGRKAIDGAYMLPPDDVLPDPRR